MKILVTDLARIATRAQAEGITQLDLQKDRLVGELETATTKTTFTVEAILKPDNTPGLRVSKTVVTKTTVLNEG